jgi:hypothetical protein
VPGLPAVNKAFVVERIAAIAGAVTWLVVFILLTIAELLSLVWAVPPTGRAVR